MDGNIPEFPAIEKLLNQEALNVSEKMLCLALWALAGGSAETECDMPVKLIAKACSRSERHVRRLIKSLEAKKFISVEAQFLDREKRARTTNKYILWFNR